MPQNPLLATHPLAPVLWSVNIGEITGGLHNKCCLLALMKRLRELLWGRTEIKWPCESSSDVARHLLRSSNWDVKSSHESTSPEAVNAALRGVKFSPFKRFMVQREKGKYFYWHGDEGEINRRKLMCEWICFLLLLLEGSPKHPFQ